MRHFHDFRCFRQVQVIDLAKKLGNPTFGFDFSSYVKAVKEINNLKTRKVSQKTDIPVKLVKENVDIASFSCIIISIARCHVLPFPLCILPNLSKVYKRPMYSQIYTCSHTILSKFQCRFGKGFHSQHCLLAMVEKWRKTIDEGGETGTVLMTFLRHLTAFITIC